jgi:hypothetical protein
MHPLDEIVPFDKFDAEIKRLGELLDELEIAAESGSNLEDQTYLAFTTLYYSVFSDERPSMNRADQIEAGAALAGLGDLAAKINRTRNTTGFDQLRPHLAKMVQGSVRMNAPSSVTDEAANKNSELYVGCLALGAGLDVELEDPNKSAGGKNPDVLLSFEGTEWSIAVKTSHSASPPTIFDNIRMGVEQIERSGRNGIVFINVKNIIDHNALAVASPFASIDAATAAVAAQIDGINNSVLSAIVEEDWIDVFKGKRARPLIAVMGQMTVSGELIPGLQMFVPVKVLRILTAPLAPSDSGKLVGVDAAAWRLLEKLNHELQRNAGSTEPIGS